MSLKAGKLFIFSIFLGMGCFFSQTLTAAETTHHAKAHSSHHHASQSSHHKASKKQGTKVKHHAKAHHSKPLHHASNQAEQKTSSVAALSCQTKLNLSQNSVCSTAKLQLGKPYAWGGDTPLDGFDCSGFSQYVYGKEGVRIPRTALEQYASLTPVKHLQDGDLVFFKTFGHRVSHVGIYLGHGYFIHSPKTGERIRIDNIDEPYWHEHYAGARRVLTNQA